MKKLTFKVTTTFLSTILCLSLVYSIGIHAIASEVVKDEVPPPFSITKIQHQLNEISINSNEVLLNVKDVNIQESMVNDSKVLSNIQSQENQPPVAGLRMVVLNPASMINGKLTTKTQVAWLWSYNGENYSYDPDGDQIVDMQVGGISNNDIIGSISGNIGFATQFKTAAQYQLTFKVQDSRGAWSNTAKYVFNVEPADGSARPTAKISSSSNQLIPNQLLMISWAGSDNLDKIASIGGMVIKDGVTTPITDFVKQMNETNCVVSFNEVGSYEIWFRVGDKNNAWSDWTILTVSVESASMTDVTINGIYEPTSTSAWWVDNQRAISTDVEASQAGAEYLFEHFGSHNFPSSLPDKIVTGVDFKVSGRLISNSGNPIANTSVTINMPLTRGCGIYQTILTDSNGYFSYQPKTDQFWFDTGYLTNGIYDYRAVGDISDVYTKYIRSSSTGTNYLYPTVIKVSAGGKTYTEEITFSVGYTKVQSVGNIMYSQGNWMYIGK
jgi:hypothetical protein